MGTNEWCASNLKSHIDIVTRCVCIGGITSDPNGEWMKQVARNLTDMWDGFLLVLPPSSVGEMTLRLYGALNYSQNSIRDLRFALNGA